MLATSILWKLSEYEDFVSVLLKAGGARACAAVIESLGPPQAGPLQHWLQVSVQVSESIEARIPPFLIILGWSRSDPLDI